MNYSEKLRDPRRQRKRLEVLQAADFMCQNCGAKDKTLHVHHGYYQTGLDPWEYPDNTLHVFCESCHKQASALQKQFAAKLGELNLWDLYYMLGVVECHILLNSDSGQTELPGKDGPGRRTIAWGIGRLLDLQPEAIEAFADDHGQIITSDDAYALLGVG